MLSSATAVLIKEKSTIKNCNKKYQELNTLFTTFFYIKLRLNQHQSIPISTNREKCAVLTEVPN